jgi:hypothetical protein
MEEMKRISVRLPAEQFDRVKREIGGTNANVLTRALEALVADAKRLGSPTDSTETQS